MSLLTLLLALYLRLTQPHGAAEVSRSEQRPPLCAATTDERWIIRRESGGDTHAYNPVLTPTGHAFGVGQLTDYQRYRFGRRLGIRPDSTRFCDQLRLMRAYIRERYGDAESAVAHWRLVGSY